MNVLLYGSEVRVGTLLSLDDRIIILDESGSRVLCNISQNLYNMLKQRNYIWEAHALRNIDDKLYNIIARMTGLSR